MDYGKLWAVRLWEGMRPLMGGCDTLRAFSGPGHPPVNLLGTVSLRQTTLELWPVVGAVPSLTSEITIPSFIVVLREGVKKNRIYLGLCPKHQTPPTHRARLGLH